MSQKVRILNIDVKGASVYLGLKDNDNSASGPIFSRNGKDIGEWLAAGWRTRFNAYRSRRKKTLNGELVPLGRSVDDRSTAQARKEQSWLAAIPSLVLESPYKLEKQDWNAALQRRKTLAAKGADPGAMPKFRSATRDHHIFTCWFNGGRNATFTRVGRRRGIVSITGQNPAGHRLPGEGARFVIRIHVRLSQPIRAYTSVRVNLTTHTLVFVNDPLPIPRASTGKTVGIDAGITHNLTLDDGTFLDLPTEKLTSIDKRVRALQRKQDSAVKASGHTSQRDYRAAGASKRFHKRETEIRRLKAKAARITKDAHHKWSTRLVRKCDVIGIEDLRLSQMSRKATPKPDSENPGHFLPNGQTAKRGLNRGLQASAIGQMREFLTYKSERSGVLLIPVDAKNTSRECTKCGHIADENRKSQAVFECITCGHTAHADITATINIKRRALKSLGTNWGGQSQARPGPCTPALERTTKTPTP